MTLRIGNGAGFLGDSLDAPRLLAEGAELDYLTLEYLAELTMSILARAREKDPQAGYAKDFLAVLDSLRTALHRQPKLRIVTNAGGVHPRACAKAAGRVLAEGRLGGRLLAVVEGDDLLPRLGELQAAGCRFEHLDTGQPLEELGREVVAANAYLGAEPIARALDNGAHVVVTGRVADASLTVGPAIHEFRWSFDHTDRLAGASVAGHLIECGAQATGGYHRDWRELDLARVGYPIVELAPDGSCVVTKPRFTGGVVNRHTVAAQLVYEIGDPAHYLTPDVDVDFTTVEIAEEGPHRVAVRGATGGPPPDTYKVSLAYRDGYMAAGQLVVYGRDCVAKARAAAEMLLCRVRRAGHELEGTHVELLGAGEAVPLRLASDQGAADDSTAAATDRREVVLRIAARDSRREALERFLREFAPLATSGPAGLAGYTAAAGPIRPVFAYWPTTVPRELVQGRMEIDTAAGWAEK